MVEERDQIPAYELGDNVNVLFGAIIKRKYWNKIDPDVIKRIINNANGNDESIRNFVYISEHSGVLENNFLQLAAMDGMNNDFLLSLFAITLYNIGFAYHQQAIESQNDEDFKSHAFSADLAYMAAILCDKYELDAYYGMAFLYSFWVDGKTSLEFCKKYKMMENELTNAPDKSLNYMQKARKQQLLRPETLDETLKKIEKYAPHLMQLVSELPDINKRMEIEELERKILLR
jgi:hypothetical protein